MATPAGFAGRLMDRIRDRGAAMPASPAMSDSDNDNDTDSGAARAAKRRRLDTDTNAPPPAAPVAQHLVLPARLGQREDVPPPQAPGADADLGGPEYTGRLSVMADVAARQERALVLQRLKQRVTHRVTTCGTRVYTSGCWMCDVGDTSDDGTGSGYAYGLMLTFIESHPHLPREALASECVNIAERHLYRPAVRAANALDTPDAWEALERIPRLKPEDVLAHLEHTFNPTLQLVDNVREAGKLYVALAQELRDEEGKIDPRIAKEAGAALDRRERYREKFETLLTRQGIKADVQLDLRRLAAVGSTKRLEPYLLQRADTLGGATAAGASAELMAEGDLPGFGASATLVDDEAAAAPLAHAEEEEEEENLEAEVAALFGSDSGD